jgi:hypothetical protein
MNEGVSYRAEKMLLMVLMVLKRLTYRTESLTAYPTMLLTRTNMLLAARHSWISSRPPRLGSVCRRASTSITPRPRP